MLAKGIISISLIAVSFSATAQLRKYEWSTATCEYEGTFDSTQITRAQIDGAYRLRFSADFDIDLDATVFSDRLMDTVKLSIASLDKEYRERSSQVKNLDLIKSPYWEKIRQQKLTEMEKVYSLKRVTIQAYSNPCALKQFAGSDSCVKIYSDALCAGGDKLLDLWKRQVEEQSKTNDMAKDDYQKKYNSPQRMSYARNEVLVFGWWNCVNLGIVYMQADSDPEFLKVFKKVNKKCESEE